LFSLFAETFGSERRPIVEFALEDVEKVRLQKIRMERHRKSAAETAEVQQTPSGDQPASEDRNADNSRTSRKGNKRKSHNRPYKPSDSVEGPAKDPLVLGDRSVRPAKRARKSSMGTVLPDRGLADATPNTAQNVGFFLFLLVPDDTS
jgi:nucleolar protein 4